MARHFSDRDRLYLFLKKYPLPFAHSLRALLEGISRDSETQAALLAALSLEGPEAAQGILKVWCEEHPYLEDEQRYCPF